MTLVDASDLLTPVLQSKWAQEDEVLRELLAENQQDFKDNPVKCVMGLNQLSFLDNKKVEVIKAIVARYEELLKKEALDGTRSS